MFFKLRLVGFKLALPGFGVVEMFRMFDGLAGEACLVLDNPAVLSGRQLEEA